MNRHYRIAAGVLIALLFLTVATALYYIWRLRADNAVLVEQFALEKEQLEDEYTQLAIDYEGYKLQVNNDSLELKYEEQQQKMQRLIEELKQTKAADARKIAALRKELETVRGVLRYYIAQVDSLGRVNADLKAENEGVRRRIASVQQSNANLQEQNANLNKKVNLAAQLVTTGLSAQGLNKRGRATSSIRNIKQLSVSFDIAANVTAQTGQKDIYLRIMRPDDEVLTGERSGRFTYDGAQVQYSTKKTIDYGGQETAVTLYWPLAETLSPGTYRFELYADGNLIGQTSLRLEK